MAILFSYKSHFYFWWGCGIWSLFRHHHTLMYDRWDTISLCPSRCESIWHTTNGRLFKETEICSFLYFSLWEYHRHYLCCFEGRHPWLGEFLFYFCVCDLCCSLPQPLLGCVCLNISLFLIDVSVFLSPFLPHSFPSSLSFSLSPSVSLFLSLSFRLKPLSYPNHRLSNQPP